MTLAPEDRTNSKGNVAMDESLRVVPEGHEVKTGVAAPENIASGLADVLSDTYCLMVKTHIVHWNVEGPLFYAVHQMTEEQYETMFQATDDLAERMRALGQLTPMTMKAITETAAIDELPSQPSAKDMITGLAEDHERVARRLHALIELAEDQRDMVTGDLAIEKSAFHEKAAWMLRSLATE